MAELVRTTTADTMASEAIGGEHMGASYYRSFRFVGTVLGTSLSLCSAYAAYLLPVGIITYINADIGTFESRPIATRTTITQRLTAAAGPDPDYIWIPLVWAICVALGYMLFGRLSDIFGKTNMSHEERSSDRV